MSKKGRSYKRLASARRDQSCRADLSITSGNLKECWPQPKGLCREKDTIAKALCGGPVDTEATGTRQGQQHAATSRAEGATRRYEAGGEDNWRRRA